ncbi:MAG TPA: Coenzyme F420 hydrogenase/dehydrogenase, beta subunit C-terminal domain [Methanospirillum sp.]|uniref:Coenzyme F420 hydrogenase/dehydrogenase, beta subunit C-terminal domain n=1 Tax=Methanospirillum sp. TaxID=45200 RepID=UPI002BF0A05A|nr:Coenzyme F420 hydrogenase/dehydrogenase, beta subunit C-terminal domain [Methanospirillum sp.]HWQ64985.1 Coenzyme F420 hydrogenase/dehydrogenase, beta subunit C-terminal domain [Methanospirillum sp.]
MAAKGEMVYAWAKDAETLKKGECGGAITALLKYALESKTVDAVVAIKKGKDLYDAVPAVITDPADILTTAGSLHCGTLLLPKIIKKYLNGAKDSKIAVTCKGCDAMAFYEMAKRNQINLDNVILIGVNCGGSVSPVDARRMISEKFEVDPDVVHKEEIDKGQFIIEFEGGHKGIKIEELEEEGYGRRSNCRRCKMKVPRQADLACGNWGVFGEKAGKATFIEICSEKGANLLNGAQSKGAIETCAPDPKGIDIRGKVEKAMLKLGEEWRHRDFEGLGAGKDRLQKIMNESSRCIRCYQCIDNCPICYCIECSTKKPWYIPEGTVPPGFMFHLIRFAHISDSCINCGQCEELCAVDIPNALFMHAQQVELEKMFKYVPGRDLNPPIHALAEERAERARLEATGSDMIYDNVFSE